MKNELTITITKEKYTELIERSNMLEALEQVGVDNWDGYGHAMELLEEFWDTWVFKESE